jgi:hypothetical protein
VKLVDPPGADLIVVSGGVAAGVAAIVATARWLAVRGSVVVPGSASDA